MKEDYKIRLIIKTYLLCNPDGATSSQIARFITSNKLVSKYGVSSKQISLIIRNSRNSILSNIQTKTINNKKVFYLGVG